MSYQIMSLPSQSPMQMYWKRMLSQQETLRSLDYQPMSEMPMLKLPILAISVEIFQARTAAGGSIEGIDFAVTPYRYLRIYLPK